MLVRKIPTQSLTNPCRFATVMIATTIMLTGCLNGEGTVSSSDDSITASFTKDDETVTLSWNPPESREDGSTFMPSDVDRYEVGYGTESGTYTETLETIDTSADFADLEAGENYYFAVRVYDDNGLASDYSNELSAVVN